MDTRSLKGVRLIRLPGVEPYFFLTHQDRFDQYISAEIVESGIWEPLETELVLRLSRLYDTFLDLGANIGWYTKLATQAMRQGGRIFAFEPDRANFALLRQNVGSAKQVSAHLVESAVSDFVGVLNLHLSSTNMGDHRIYPSEPDRASVETPVTTLTAYFSNVSLGPFLLKSDTQGSEPKILRGGWNVLAKSIASSTLILEFWPHGMKKAGENVGAFIDELSLLPHESFIINNRIRKLCPNYWNTLRERARTDIAPETQDFVDLLLVPPDSRFRNAINEFIQESPVEIA